LEILQPTTAAIERAARELRQGRLVAFPTETVYGLGANATDKSAVQAVYAAKGRPSFNPLIVHVADLRAAASLARFDERARRLAESFWPGPLTLIYPRAENVSDGRSKPSEGHARQPKQFLATDETLMKHG